MNNIASLERPSTPERPPSFQERRKVVFVTQLLPQYRREFHERVRQKLAARGVDYHLLFGQPTPEQSKKGDLIEMPWATRVYTRHLWGEKLIWQNIRHHIKGASLVIVNQQNRNIANYLLQLNPMRSRPLVAYFGHGRNFQARKVNSIAERWKRFWTTRVDWWFAYTQQSREYVEKLGFPADRITVFNNSIDTQELIRLSASITPERLEQRRAEIGLSGNNICIYVGALYRDKRIGFLIQALDRIRASVPDFEFIAVGGGEDAHLLEAAAKTRPWLKLVGPRFGADKVELMSLAKLFLIPGLVGLVVLDAAVMGLPIITTNYPYHSPESAYMKDGWNGRVVEPFESVEAYASAVTDLLNGDPAILEKMSAAAAEMGSTYTVEAMSEECIRGILKALDTIDKH